MPPFIHHTSITNVTLLYTYAYTISRSVFSYATNSTSSLYTSSKHSLFFISRLYYDSYFISIYTHPSLSSASPYSTFSYLPLLSLDNLHSANTNSVSSEITHSLGITLLTLPSYILDETASANFHLNLPQFFHVLSHSATI